MLFVSVLVDITVIVSCALLALYVYLKHTLKYWERKNVPCKKPALLFGNFTRSLFLKESEGEITKKIYEEFQNERFVGGFYSHSKALIVRDPELIKTILTKDFYHFYSRGFKTDPHEEPMDLNLFMVDGDIWRVLRQNLTPLFSSAKLKNMFKLMTESGRHFESYLERSITSDQPVIVNELMPKYSMDVIGSCAFGLKVNTMDDSQDNIFSKMGLKIFESSITQVFKFLFKTFAMRLFYFLKLRFNDQEMEKFFIDLVKDTVEERERSQSTRHDFIDLMKDLKHEGVIKGNSIHQMETREEQKQIEIEVDDKLMAAQSFIFFAAGFETSSTTMSYALYELAMNTDIQSKVLDEIDSVLKKHENQVTYESLRQYEFLDMVVSETMRKYPVLGNLERRCTSKYTIPDTDVDIDEGVKILIPLLAIHRDPKYYPDPDKFDPYRFTKEAVNERHPYVYMPFGQGPRICIGLRFGKAQVMVGLISLLRNYTVHPNKETPDKIIFNAASFINSPSKGICLNLKKRPIISH